MTSETQQPAIELKDVQELLSDLHYASEEEMSSSSTAGANTSAELAAYFQGRAEGLEEAQEIVKEWSENVS